MLGLFESGPPCTGLPFACGLSPFTQSVSPTEQENHFVNYLSFKESEGVVEAVSYQVLQQVCLLETIILGSH